MSVRLRAVSYDAADPASVGRFWAVLLGRDAVAEPGGVLVPGDETQVGLRFVESKAREPVAEHLHLHLTSRSPADQQATVAEVLRLGGRHLDVGQGPDTPYVVMADPGGNALCVIEAGNRFLAGCGFLGEVTCDGSREVGLFWSQALGWPLVWDQGEETAVQSPLGGTKVSWGGPAEEPKSGRDRQRLDLVADDVEREVERLVGLGARRLSEGELADPDGHEFHVRPG